MGNGWNWEHFWLGVLFSGFPVYLTLFLLIVIPSLILECVQKIRQRREETKDGSSSRLSKV